MPSRAVLRKKQRRETRQKKVEEEGERPPSHRIAPPHLADGEEADLNAHMAAARAARKRHVEETAAAPAASMTSSSAPVIVVPKRQRVEAPVAAPMPPDLNRKERHRWETSQRLERQMTRLTTNAEAVTEMVAEAAAQTTIASDEGEGGGTVTESKLRHDPKFKHGTFWRERKEKRARTLFLGGLPAHFTVRQVTDFISTVVDSDLNAHDYVDAIGKDKDVVEEVDMLPVKHQSKVKHMYVIMASVPLAGCAAAMLDRYKMEGRELRCNFAADKTQREEAIRRRSAADHGGDSGASGGGFY